MPIRGLTDRGAAFPRIGTLRKGAPKKDNRPGSDLHHFRFDSDDAAATAAFAAAYGDEPNFISVYLPYATTGENFQAWQEEWSASSLLHRCDGVTCELWLTKKNTYSHEPKPCPGGCKPTGRLMAIVPELRRFAYVTVLTTSIHDIMELQANLEATEALRGDLRGIPFILSRRPREISTPRQDGKRARTEKWLLSIEPAPAWVGHQLRAMERAALPDGIKALTDGSHVDTTTGEVVEHDAPDFDNEAEPEVIQPAPPPKPAAKIDRGVLIKGIRKRWAEERGLTTDLVEQNQETDLDLEGLPVGSDADGPEAQTLFGLGRRIRARVDDLKAREKSEADAVAV